MKWETLLLTDDHLERGMTAIGERFSQTFSGDIPHLAILFICGYDRSEIKQLMQLIPTCLKAKQWLGCLSGGVIGQGRELENKKAISISMAHLPQVTIQPFHIAAQSFDDPQSALETLNNQIDTTHTKPHFILLSDPFTFDIETLLTALDLGFPDSIKMGGLVSGGRKPGDHIMLVNDRIYQTGLVGVALSGALQIHPLVSQGCRPIGLPMFVTASKHHLIYELDNNSPIEALRQIFETLSEPDQELFQQALTLGIATTKQRETLYSGDFLIRQIIGGEPSTGHLAIAATIAPYQVVQFHLRDPLASRKELDTLLKRFAHGQTGQPLPIGGLMFSCLSRGKELFGLANHDSNLFHDTLGPLPLGGFFCHGEIGPIHGKTFLHGATSAFCLISPSIGEPP
ncbi:MAG: FIST C-terminal domain-containing protein [Nitrospirae bacterium]|nr:FIST C-terminal domain-containing protein [Magnetococcales bacterium]